RAGDGLDALAAPRPHRRADIVDRAHAARLEARFQPEVEVGSVYAYEQRCLDCGEAAQRLAADPEKLRKVRQHFDVSAQRELRQRIPDLAPGALHTRPT